MLQSNRMQCPVGTDAHQQAIDNFSFSYESIIIGIYRVNYSNYASDPAQPCGAAIESLAKPEDLSSWNWIGLGRLIHLTKITFEAPRAEPFSYPWISFVATASNKTIKKRTERIFETFSLIS